MNVKPIRLTIPHPVINTSSGNVEEAEVCLIVKQEDKAWVEEMVESTYSEYLNNVKLVVGLQDLRTKYGQFKQRRELLKGYDLFIADDRILPMLRSALGGKFIIKKKFPVPVRLSKHNPDALPLAVRRSIVSTYMYQVRGNSLSVRAGHTGMSEEELVENFEAVVEGVTQRIPRGWGNILNISIKTGQSVSLPFYNRRPDELAELEQLIVQESSCGGGKNDDDDEADIDESKSKKLAAKSPLLRAMKKQKKNERENVTQTDSGKKTPSKKKSSQKGSEDSDKIAVVATPVSKISKKFKDQDEQASKIANKRKVDEREANSHSLLVKESAKAAKANARENLDMNTPAKKVKSSLKTPKASTSKKTKIQNVEKNEPIADIQSKVKSEKVESVATPEANPRFVKSNKFKGAKEGYVFKAGPKGTGYYKDELPIVNKAALAAFRRLGGGNSRTPRSSAKKRKGRR